MLIALGLIYAGKFRNARIGTSDNTVTFANKVGVTKQHDIQHLPEAQVFG